MHYDVILVGTGFASTFFLQRFLLGTPPERRLQILVLERGQHVSHGRQLGGERRTMSREAQASFVNQGAGGKRWTFLLGHGGGSNCWTGNVPRMLPEDFRLRSTYGVAVDWPLAYEDLEPYYCDAEDLMGVAGPSDDSPFRRSRPYPLPPHRFSSVDRALKAAWPDAFFHAPSARPTRPTDRRPACCASHVCTLCPIDSKFTVLNEMPDVYADERVAIRYGCRVDALDVTAGATAAGVLFTQNGRQHRATGDLVVLGANALFNAHILMRSGLEHPQLGAGLVEEVSMMVRVALDGIDNFDGGTFVTGHGYMLYGGDRRATRAAALIETNNRPELRMERGKWRQQVTLRVIYEDHRQDRNRVRPDPADPSRPVAVYESYSDYTQRGIDQLPQDIERIFASLPVEWIEYEPDLNSTEAHIEGTTPMGDDPAVSIVDRHQLHHRLRNVYVLGSSTFPTCDPSNPTLTLSALALRAGDHAARGAYVSAPRTTTPAS